MHFLLAVFACVFIAYCAANSVGVFAGTFYLCIYGARALANAGEPASAF